MLCQTQVCTSWDYECSRWDLLYLKLAAPRGCQSWRQSQVQLKKVYAQDCFQAASDLISLGSRVWQGSLLGGAHSCVCWRAVTGRQTRRNEWRCQARTECHPWGGRAALKETLVLSWEISFACPRDISQGFAYELVSIVQSCQHFQENITVTQLFHAPSSSVSISFKSDLCLTMFGLQILLTLCLSEERQI